MKNNVKDKFKKQKKNRKTLKKELTEGEWMADSIAIAHVELNVFQIIFLKQNFVLFPIFATTNSYACRVWSILIKYGHICAVICVKTIWDGTGLNNWAACGTQL